MTKVPPGEGFSPLWRIGWHIQHALLHVFGPASLDAARDPRVAMRRQYDLRKAAHLRRQAAKKK
jgi:hypothetical protein